MHLQDAMLKAGQRRYHGAVGKVIYRLLTTTVLATCLATPTLAETHRTPTRSSTIALTRNDSRLVVVNRDTHSMSIMRVRDGDGNDSVKKLAEVAVGREPRCVALSPDNGTAYVTNGASDDVSVVLLKGVRRNTEVRRIPVGTEPRGCATTPNGSKLYVANHTNGTVSVIDTATWQVVDTVRVGGNPTAIAITNDGDNEDDDERVFVTRFFAKLIENGPGEGFDTGKQGIVRSFPVNNPSNISTTRLSPVEDVGFTANRAPFCSQFNSNAHSDIFCPDTAISDPADPTIAQDPQGAFPNQFYAALIRDDRLYLPNIGAGPEPPVRFNVNVQALVHVADITTQQERRDLHTNLNSQVAAERQAGNTDGIDGLFGNDIVDIDADRRGQKFLIVSRGGNFVFNAQLDSSGRMDLQSPNIVRFQTGNLPNGIVVSKDGTRAYTNNEADISVTAIDLEQNKVIDTVAAGTPPPPGTFEHLVLVGKLAFFTALGIPDNDIFDTPIRDIIPLNDRGKASDNAWSSCGSCHPDGLSDGVTWHFATGPRQTVPLDAFFSKDNPADQRISNWSAVRGSITDFNNNSRNVQGGIGFAGEPPNPEIFNHGITQGASDALDVQTLWVETVRALNLPPRGNADSRSRGETLFETNCASCHGGAKWTKSQVIYTDNPAFFSNPLASGVPRDPGVTNAGPQIVSYTVEANTINFLEDIGTYDPNDPREIRGAGLQGFTAVGGLGFNVPSLLSTCYHAPYLHNGAAQTLPDVFPLHNLNGGTIADALNTQEQSDLFDFLCSIDGRTDKLRSAADDFRDLIGN